MRKKLLKKGFAGFALASALMISAMTVSASELPVEGTTEEQAVTDEAALIETEETVDSGLYDKTPPVIKSLKFDKTKVTYPEQITVTAEITDDLSGVKNGFIAFRSENNNIISIAFTEHDGDIYTSTSRFDEYTVPGVYKFYEILLSDQMENYSILYEESLNTNEWENEYVSKDYLNSLQIEVVNDAYKERSEEIPVLNSIEIVGETNVTAPGVVELVADVTSPLEIDSFYVEFTGMLSAGYTAMFSNTYMDYTTGKEIPYPDGKWHAEIAIDEHLREGQYLLREIIIMPKGGKTYMVSRGSQTNPIADEHLISFNVQGTDKLCDGRFGHEETDNATYTSDGYTVKSLYNFTKNTKDTLAGIKGTDKNCIFTDARLSYFNNSIQLIFKGKEMTGEPRDIDLNVEKYVLSQSKTARANAIREQVGDTPAYVLDFSDKGDFPGDITVRFRDVKINSYRSLREYLGTEGLCLYEYKDGAVNLVAENLSIAKDNYYEFTVDHGATYVVTGGKVAEKQDNQPEKETTTAEKQGEEFATNDGNAFTKDENGAVRCYDEETGEPVIDDFKCDGTYTYYFQADGTAMQDRLTYHPDGVHVIYFDSNGHEVFSNFANVKKTIAGETVDDYCFFDVNGYLYVDVVTYDQAGKELYYANPYGVLERGKWFQFSDTVKCADGNAWPGAAGNYGYANADGTLMVNQYTYDWEGRYCYLQGNGAAKYN